MPFTEALALSFLRSSLADDGVYSSPAMAALMPAASSLPVLLAILPAGAGADVCDCRCVLLVMDIWGICRKFLFLSFFDAASY